MKYQCPVCGYPNLQEPPLNSYEICPSCGTEFGYTDFRRSHDELRIEWLRKGPRWHAQWLPEPENWQPKRQLLEFLFPTTGRHVTGGGKIPTTYEASSHSDIDGSVARTQTAQAPRRWKVA